MNKLKKEKLNAEYKIAVIDGDGIGPEIVAQAIKVLKRLKILAKTLLF